jgi:hypothetical protein
VVSRLGDLEITPPSPLGIAVQWVGHRPSKDALTGKKLEEWTFFFGAPPGAAARAGKPPVAAPLPGTLDACQRELSDTHARLRVRLAQLAGFRPSAVLFAAGPSAPELTTEVQAAADRAGVKAGVECRSGICRLRFDRTPDPAVLARLRADPDLGERIGKPQKTEGDLYITVRERGGPTLARLLTPVRTEGYFARCPPPDRVGNVLLRLLVPETGMPNEDGVFDHASVQLAGGTLAGTPAAGCLTEQMAAVLSAQPLPQPVGGHLRFESWTWRPGQPPVLVTPPP